MTLFTVEQLELIRRLRSTGITADAVLEAFRTLENVEANLNTSSAHSAALTALTGPSRLLNVASGRLSENCQAVHSNPLLLQQLTDRAIRTTSASTPFGTSTSAPQQCPAITSPVDGRHPGAVIPPATRLDSHTPTTSLPLHGFLAGGASLITPLTAFSSGSLTNLSAAPRTGPIRPSKSAQSSPPSMMSPSTNRPVRSQRTPMKEIITLDDPSELGDFLAHSEEACIAEMKSFITLHSLRQTTVATMTGVSQPYISKLLNGNHTELSLRCRKNIYCWYLNCRRHPEKLASFLQDATSSVPTRPDGELMVPQRRERYAFRPVLIKILEGYFRVAPFPDCAKRAEIAVACNRALQTEKMGSQLMAKEVVTPQVVANWFANRRKEMRRRSHERDSSPNVHAVLAGDSMESISDCDSTPSPPVNASGVTPTMSLAIDGAQQARPFVHMRERFTSGNIDDAVPTALSQNTSMPTSLFDLLNMPAHSSPATPTTAPTPTTMSVPPQIDTSLTPNCQDLLNHIVQNGVLNYANSVYLDECALQSSQTIDVPV